MTLFNISKVVIREWPVVRFCGQYLRSFYRTVLLFNSFLSNSSSSNSSISWQAAETTLMCTVAEVYINYISNLSCHCYLIGCPLKDVYTIWLSKQMQLQLIWYLIHLCNSVNKVFKIKLLDQKLKCIIWTSIILLLSPLSGTTMFIFPIIRSFNICHFWFIWYRNIA